MEAAAPPIPLARRCGQRQRAIDWLAAEGARFITRALQKDQPGQKVLAPPRRLIAGLDWEGRGGDVVMRQLEQNLVKRGGTLMRGTQVTELVVETGACSGVIARHNGASVRVDPRGCHQDGGFAANPQMVAQYIRHAPIACWRGGAGRQR